MIRARQFAFSAAALKMLKSASRTTSAEASTKVAATNAWELSDENKDLNQSCRYVHVDECGKIVQREEASLGDEVAPVHIYQNQFLKISSLQKKIDLFFNLNLKYKNS